ncbi:unnamed protein product [Vitrella brassicaformis CCMP3155]|uniref:Radical SAM core domain-containing protein n=2 Tax=Vitrella brassicaformis TaxID=1169539 RepID=A0A0G4FA14_VITBC|nr:unnamed protein product [Vitrella brassicaformis CCMP3155]|eukprot:CEM09761.1 unnamed protein product [Vitrella brassicaformis CCMP3155]
MDGWNLWMKERGHPAYRAKQIWQHLYERRAGSFDAMTNLPKTMRDDLKASLTFGDLMVADERVSRDGTLKRAYVLRDGQVIESVLMPYKDGRRTACISSQAGCAMGCVFCATGQMGFARQLSSAEIVEQALIFARELHQRGERLSNVVLMGMGEPLANYDNAMEAVERINHDLGVGMRHITVSTVGLPERIKQIADEGRQVTLAVSLHAASDQQRSALIPINKKHPIQQVMQACVYYCGKTGRRISFEWALIAGETDTPQQADQLGRLLSRAMRQGLIGHVNLIPVNPTEGYDGRPSSPLAVSSFIDTLKRHGVGATARLRRGIDIEGGCGQLKAETIKRQQKESQRGTVEVAA